MVYGAVAVLSVLLLIGYLLIEKKKERNFIFLISCVAIVNTGYFLLAAANSLPMAMFANGVSYFGAAYSMLAMLLIISEVCQMKKRMWQKSSLSASVPLLSCWQPVVTGWDCIIQAWILPVSTA